MLRYASGPNGQRRTVIENARSQGFTQLDQNLRKLVVDNESWKC